MEPTELAVECIDLRRVFRLGGMLRRKGEVQALRGVSLEIPRGQVFGLLGPNGAGKTTTVRILATLLHPSAGEVLSGVRWAGPMCKSTEPRVPSSPRGDWARSSSR